MCSSDLIDLPRGTVFHDKDGHARRRARVKWWDTSARTYRAAALGVTEAQRGELPDSPLPADAQLASPEGIVCFGHYWLDGIPSLPASGNAVCVDYSACRGGSLVAYRF